MHLFLCPAGDDKLKPLNEEESSHALRVLRLRIGDPMLLTDGQGTFYEAVVEEAEKHNCVARVTRKKETEERPFRIHIAVAPTKNSDRLEWFAEKATELGIAEITPLICQHSERKVQKTDRLKKTVLSAMKQSMRCFLPTIHEPIGLSEFIKQQNFAYKFIATQGASDELLKIAPQKCDVCVLIGPEGDFSEHEINIAKEAGFIPVGLGPARLRTETAALAACHIINLINQA